MLLWQETLVIPACCFSFYGYNMFVRGSKISSVHNLSVLMLAFRAESMSHVCQHNKSVVEVVLFRYRHIQACRNMFPRFVAKSSLAGAVHTGDSRSSSSNLEAVR